MKYIILALSMLGIAHSPEAPRVIYKNKSGYALSLSIPQGTRICYTNPPSPDHGIYILPDGEECGENASAHSYISFFVSFNVGDGPNGEYANSPRKLAIINCKNENITNAHRSIQGLPLIYCTKRNKDETKTMIFSSQLKSSNDPSSEQNYIIEMKYKSREKQRILGILDDILQHSSHLDGEASIP